MLNTQEYLFLLKESIDNFMKELLLVELSLDKIYDLITEEELREFAEEYSEFMSEKLFLFESAENIWYLITTVLDQPAWSLGFESTTIPEYADSFGLDAAKKIVYQFGIEVLRLNDLLFNIEDFLGEKRGKEWGENLQSYLRSLLPFQNLKSTFVRLMGEFDDFNENLMEMKRAYPGIFPQLDYPEWEIKEVENENYIF